MLNVATDTLIMNQKNHSWLLLTYKVPAEPTKIRVGIWRRIRSLGAVYLQNSICVLPLTAEHQRQLRMVQSDIEQVGGEAVIFETQALDAKQKERVVAYFKRDREQDYEEFLEKCADYRKEIETEVQAGHYSFAEVKENDKDLKKLKNWLERIKVVDFYGAPARAMAEQQLVECEALLENYANEVFEREQDAKTAPTIGPATAKKATAKRPAKRAIKP